MSNKQLEVQIMGQSYLLVCPEGGEARLLADVDQVDPDMCTVRAARKTQARDRIAVLAALNLAFEQPESSSSAETQTAKAPIQTAAFNDADNDRLGQLLKKLDQALHKDGQLI